MVDVLFVVVVVFFAVLGYAGGLSRHAWVMISALLALVLGDGAASVFSRGAGSVGMTLGITFGLFLALWIGGTFVGQAFFEKTGKSAERSPIGGALMGAAKGILIASVVLWFVTYFFLRMTVYTGNPVQEALRTSSVVSIVDGFNPLNLFKLKRIRPFIPVSVSGNRAGMRQAPSDIASNAHFRALLDDPDFLSAYREGRYLAIMRNPKYRALLRDYELMDKLDRLSLQVETDFLDWENSAR